MTIFISILAAVVVSAAVTFGLKRFDKNENSMEKIKNYANKKQGEFDVFFKKRAEELKQLTTDLETQDIKAKAAVNRLQQQIDECDKTTKNLELVLVGLFSTAILKFFIYTVQLSK